LRALTADPRIGGVTLLGGEPFDQASALADLAESIQDRGLSVITFTGHLLEDLRRQADAGTARLLAATDLLIDGPYDRRVPDTRRPLVGSRNQRYINLTTRYVDWVDNLHVQPDRLEVRIRREGTIQVTGWAYDPQRRALIEGLGAKRARTPRPAEATVRDWA
jgi:anaerobic ribonucleoside-triphosphate reductase activating protein